MLRKRFILALAPILFLVCTSSHLRAQLIVVEPDSYTNGAVLNTVVQGVSLITAGANNLPHPPQPFNIWATETTFPWTPPTGTKVFSHVGVAFFNPDRRLRMDFEGTVSSLSIIFQGGNNLAVEQGRLEAYDASGALLDSFLTAPLLGGQTQTMSINRANPDIAWAVAYTYPGQSTFGRLDYLTFTAPVPEPSTLALVGLLGLASVVSIRKAKAPRQ